MQRAVVVLLFCITLLVGSLNADHHLSKHGHSPHHRYNHVQPAPVCEYQSVDGDTFSLSPLAKLTTDLQFTDESSNVYYFHPCGDVVTPGCPANSAICMIDASGTPVSFGTPSSVEYSDGVFGESTFEAIYGNGDVCGDEQVPRKTLVEFVCSTDELASSTISASSTSSSAASTLSNSDSTSASAAALRVVSTSSSTGSNSVASAISSSMSTSVADAPSSSGVQMASSSVQSESQEQPTSRIVSVETDGCFLTIVVSSPNACNVQDYCNSITEEDACRATSKVCVWKNLQNTRHSITPTSTLSDSTAPQGVCQPYRGLRHFSSTMYGVIAIISVIAVLSIFLFVGMVCVYYCRKIKGRTMKKNKKNAKSCAEVKMSLINDETNYEEQGLEMVEELTPVNAAGEANLNATAPPVQVAIFFPGQQIPANPYTGYGYQPMALQWIPPQMDISSDK